MDYRSLAEIYRRLSGGFLKNAVTKPIIDKATNELVYPTFTVFVNNVALPEFLIGLGLILGGFTAAAAFFGLLMNLMFLFAGTVSTNPWMFLIGWIIFMAGVKIK